MSRIRSYGQRAKYSFGTLLSLEYWRYALVSKEGIRSVLFVYGGLYLFIETLDFFKVYTRDDYGSYAFLLFLLVAIIISLWVKRPITSVKISIPASDCIIEVRVANIFDVNGSVVVSTNTMFEANVADGVISPESIQGQFTSKYFSGNQSKLISLIKEGLPQEPNHDVYPMGTTVRINTHGKTFYLTAMASLNEKGNAQSTRQDLSSALEGLWNYVRTEGELQELAIPVMGTGRGRLGLSRKRVIGMIVESFVKHSYTGLLTNKLVICIRPSDAERFMTNLYDIKDYMNQIVHA